MNLKKLTVTILEKNKTYGQKEGRPDNRRLAQWRVKWLIEHSTTHQILWSIDSFVLRNPPLRQAPKRYASPYDDRKQTDRQK
jgi:hypothetical protein